MLELLTMPLPLAAGFALGGIFYGGLWWTVREAARFRRPGLTILSSAGLRMAMVLGGFYVVAGGDWRRMLLCLLGFLLGRLTVTLATRLPAPLPSKGANDAP